MVKLLKSKQRLISDLSIEKRTAEERIRSEYEKKIDRILDDHKKELERIELKHRTQMAEQKTGLEALHRSKIKEVEDDYAKTSRQDKLDYDRRLLIERNKVQNKLADLEKDSTKIIKDRKSIEKEREFLGVLFMKAGVLQHGLKTRKKEIDIEYGNILRILDDIDRLRTAYGSGKIELSEYDGIPMPPASVIKENDL